MWLAEKLDWKGLNLPNFEYPKSGKRFKIKSVVELVHRLVFYKEYVIEANDLKCDIHFS
jgi:hypothetical protein